MYQINRVGDIADKDQNVEIQYSIFDSLTNDQRSEERHKQAV
jgi:hypothetical protein